MIGHQRLVCDTSCEIYSDIQTLVDESFWDFERYEPQPGDVVVLATTKLVIVAVVALATVVNVDADVPTLFAT